MRVAPSSSSSSTGTASDPRWSRIVSRDKSADGRFWYSVATTGIYCRPSCPSRGANPRNVRIHETLAAAKATGYRACKRCNPDGLSVDAENGELVARACRLLEATDEVPSLSELAASVELSPYYFHRLFKRATGLTPKRYAAAHRAQRVRASLPGAASVTEAIYQAGFSSSSRFYERARESLGMPPASYRQGGLAEVLTFAAAQCSLGAIVVASSAVGVAAIFLGDDPDALVRELQDRFPRAQLVGGDARYEQLVARVVAFVEAPGNALDLPLDVRGTAFQQRVWQALRTVPAGETASYQEIAERIGARGSVRAVAGACAANRLAVAIPCHRVVRQDGAISGYRWGVERKRALLARERTAGPA
jgi:AraC family transcriptional regulator of adaptative response/methylated-DNA-[protein]-cysteine methyltransferase